MASTHMLCQSIVLHEHDQPLTYKKPDALGLKYTKLALEDGGRTRKKEILAWNTTNGKNLEGFCQVYQEFKILMGDWGYNNSPARKFECFWQFLYERPRTIFDANATSIRATTGTTLNTFQTALTQTLEQIAGDCPCDQEATEYILNPDYVRKRHDDDVFTHASCLEVLFNYHDLLPGTTPTILGNQIEKVRQCKMLLFHSFPLEWQNSYLHSRGCVNADMVSWQDILAFMDVHKTAVDERKIRRNAANSPRNAQARGTQGGRGFGRTMNGGRGHQFQPYLLEIEFGGDGYSPSSVPIPNEWLRQATADHQPHHDDMSWHCQTRLLV